MNSRWRRKKLGDVCQILSALVDPREPEFIDLPHIGAGNMISGTGELIDIKTAKEEGLKSGKYTFDRSMVLYSKIRPYLMKVARPDFSGLCSADVYPLSPDTSQLDQDFLFHLLLSKEFTEYAIAGSSRAGMPKVNRDHLFNFTTRIPPLPEQKRIVAILDEAFEGIDSAIANTEKNLANARELFESYLNAIFIRKGDDWIEQRLDRICSIKHGFAFKGEFFTNEETDYVVLTPGSFYESGGYREQGTKTKYYTGEIPKDYILQKGDFLFAMTEQAVGLLGSSLIVPESDRFLHNQRLGLVQVFDNVAWYNDFFFHQFNTARFRAAVQDSASGAKVRHTSPKKLGAISVCFPPTVQAQKQVSDKLNTLHADAQRLEAIYQTKLSVLKELKQSILQKAFSGELTNSNAQQLIGATKDMIAA